MARTRDRQRALARAKLDRQIARRAAAARKKRQIQAGTAAGLAVVLIALGALWFSGFFDGEKDKNPPQGSGTCAWNSTEGGENVKDVGRPPTGDIQTSGAETMTITTNQGVIKAIIDTAKVPCAAASFSFLSGKGYFDNTKCHRLTTDGGYVLQCGDPSGTGSGGPGYRYADENLPQPLPSASTDPSASPSASASAAAGQALYTRGMLAMANSGDDTNGSQFFIVYKDSPVFQAKYTILGTVTEGLEVVDKIAESGVAEGGTSPTDGKPKVDVTIQSLIMSSNDAPAETPSSQPASASPSASTQ